MLIMGRYTPDNFDQQGYLKPPLGFYLLIILLLRPYIIWLLTIIDPSDDLGLITYVYPEKQHFLLGLLVGAGALMVLILLSLRRKTASIYAVKLWFKGQWWLWYSVLGDLLITLWLVKSTKFAFEPIYAGVLLGLFFTIWYLLKSRYIQDLFADWPEHTYCSRP